MRDELDPLVEAGELAGVGAAVVAGGVSVTVRVGVAIGVVVTVGVSLMSGRSLALLVGRLMLLLGVRLAIAPPPPLCPHPAARNPVAITPARRTRLLLKRRRMPTLRASSADRLLKDMASNDPGGRVSVYHPPGGRNRADYELNSSGGRTYARRAPCGC
jgi:hypothetical protein